ncbi:DUF1128 domain-containing protein [Lentibacillus sp. CBA3610]|uniref:DUF1128 domain-containing protein n=1 Tax=Lentibacillus sp. CBA3610 TaxID=2518176 RepID=UPI001594F961|nr:DUF1128 domain-containing protein [Lentibacillus sp. CBA3610]QKY69005.1 DUF1128 domain-containing protein [Lentibacillus sp. CBA3610]
MNLENPTQENLKFMLDELAEQLSVVNPELLDSADYDLEKYEDIKFMYDMVKQKGHLSASETQAFIAELRSVRKS